MHLRIFLVRVGLTIATFTGIALSPIFEITGSAEDSNEPTLAARSSRLAAEMPTGIYFEENRGQHDARVKFMTRGGGPVTFITGGKTAFVVPEKRDNADPATGSDPARMRATAVHVSLVGGSESVEFTPNGQTRTSFKLPAW